MLIIFVVLVGVLHLGCSSDNPQQSQMTHAIGDVWAVSYPTIIALNNADHTFLKGLDDQGQSYIWKCFSQSTQGEELSDTRTDGEADLTVVGFMANETPCKWPLAKYLSVGVCHQCANRGLYYTGKTVYQAAGYAFFAGIYGTYGEDPEETFSMQSCLASAPDWQGPDFLSAPIDAGAVPGPEQTDEILLAAAYQKSRSAGFPNPMNSQARNAYLDRLMTQKIRHRLGEDFPTHVLAALQAARRKCLEEKQALDQWAASGQDLPTEVIAAYEALFNDLAAQYKEILTPREYEALFALDYDAPIILEKFVPIQDT